MKYFSNVDALTAGLANDSTAVSTARNIRQAIGRVWSAQDAALIQRMRGANRSVGSVTRAALAQTSNFPEFAPSLDEKLGIEQAADVDNSWATLFRMRDSTVGAQNSLMLQSLTSGAKFGPATDTESRARVGRLSGAESFYAWLAYNGGFEVSQYTAQDNPHWNLIEEGMDDLFCKYTKEKADYGFNLIADASIA